MKEPVLSLTPDLVKLIAEIDEFKGRWQALKTLSPDRLNALRKVAIIESIGSSTRIEGAKLTDAQVETLLSNWERTAFLTRDEQEGAGYAEVKLCIDEFEQAPVLLAHHLNDCPSSGISRQKAACLKEGQVHQGFSYIAAPVC